MNTVKVGEYISKMRKERQMTQADLAKLLNITHQAISRWENGICMPDVTVLMKLAEIFQVSVDNILKGRMSLEIKCSDNNKVVCYKTFEGDLGYGMNHYKEIVNNANVISNQVYGRYDFKGDHSKRRYKNPQIKVLIDMAPFIGEKKVDEIVDYAYENEPAKGEIISRLAAFSSSEKLENLIMKAFEGELDQKCASTVAPFVKVERLECMLDEVICDNKENLERVLFLVPFISSDKVRELYSMFQENDHHKATMILPFLGNDYVEELACDLMNKLKKIGGLE